ncbi:expressed unknown protein [Seminavis robusta]|uniref:Uncharacterized protein n=1 Tax=Seminavis robusta TaxID=568900 RepID=A0A9N8HLX7_9STRA|nr:expressed unknown protein [Seminavis robusta]|eukprot:Sro709_g190820.1 n/a (167) ;mRNA; f:13160-13660
MNPSTTCITDAKIRRESWGCLDESRMSEPSVMANDSYAQEHRRSRGSLDRSGGSSCSSDDDSRPTHDVHDRRSSWGDLDSLLSDFHATMMPASSKPNLDSITEATAAEEEAKAKRRANRRRKKEADGSLRSSTGSTSSTKSSGGSRRDELRRKISRKRLSASKLDC